MEGKVIRILNNSDLLIGIGSNDGVTFGQKFEIYEPGETVTDPESGTDLGPLDYIKATVEVTEIHPKFSLVRDQSKTRETVSRGLMSAFSETTSKITKININPLPIDEKDISPRHIKQKLIKLGDPVRSI
ncbi:MAG: hypothetical protein ABF723_05750 [Lentilactobacillus hilgardii]|jgi:CBS domain containing-hemolysin-like protein|uniref:hypothetical protein n=1 Tax=Lentilactobacillus hilgardii TaxID=1588 RepID=UPI001CC1CF8F|nr:hypothetical protein [Lentilactobacillus hilgardii]MBZ2200793.1 hypothetical protein [Lentilactobacillus hilgardii]MBZ2203792.1 hypothetical protein [Lentilactobacillus hilgardii]